VAIIRSNFHLEMTERLEAKCLETLTGAGIPMENIDRFAVPGCLEIPWAAHRLAVQKKYDLLIALGVVIRGDTYHFDIVANECARGTMQVSLSHDVPIVFEVLATYNLRDAARRSGNNALNKGIEAGRTALRLLATMSEIAGKG
jgi:6,7-dimethyl-8-ribityllumazine synthase